MSIPRFSTGLEAVSLLSDDNANGVTGCDIGHSARDRAIFRKNT